MAQRRRAIASGLAGAALLILSTVLPNYFKSPAWLLVVVMSVSGILLWLALLWTNWVGNQRTPTAITRSIVAFVGIAVAMSIVTHYLWPEPENQSFVIVGPGPLLNGDTWDFLVTLKGSEKVESVDGIFVDNDKLDFLKQSLPAGSNLMPNEYSFQFHIDEMFPKGRGAIFAKQLLWKPYSLEHGHYRLDISTSTGRFHEELYIERINNKWQYAAALDDIDTKELRFSCRDPDFPASVAQSIVALGKCYPEIVTED